MPLSLEREKRAAVWVVDDSPLDGERARRALIDEYDVRVFTDGSVLLEALTVVAAPDVLVLDRVMPGVSGIEVCKYLRSGAGAMPQLAILLLTTQMKTDDIVEGLAAGANDYLVKPYSDPELVARVRALVRWNGLLERAQKAEASVLMLLAHAPDPLITVDKHQRVVYLNREAQRVLEGKGNHLLGTTLQDSIPGLEFDRLVEAADTGCALPDVEIGAQIFSPTIRALPSSDATLTVALRDVTARREREARRLDFYSMMAHDLRSPLGAMGMRTDLMLRGHRGPLSPEVTADLRKMEGNIKRLVELINDFLDFASMEDAAHKLERTPLALNLLTSDVLDEFKPLLDHAKLTLELDLKEGLTVWGDRPRLQQVLTNLLANSIKFTPAGGRIRLTHVDEGDFCRLIVEDTGPGIASEILPTLFQRYARGAGGTSDKGGTGLGLLIVREIVEAHGGTVGVDSTLGRGSRFWFRLPTSQ